MYNIVKHCKTMFVFLFTIRLRLLATEDIPLAADNLNAPSGYIAVTSIVELHIVLEIVLSRLSKIRAWIKACIFCIDLGDAHPSFS